MILSTTYRPDLHIVHVLHYPDDDVTNSHHLSRTITGSSFNVYHIQKLRYQGSPDKGLKIINLVLIQLPSRKGAQSKRPYTAKNTVFSTNFLVWNFFGKAKFPHSFGRFRKLGEITVFYAVLSKKKNKIKKSLLKIKSISHACFAVLL